MENRSLPCLRSVCLSIFYIEAMVAFKDVFVLLLVSIFYLKPGFSLRASLRPSLFARRAPTVRKIETFQDFQKIPTWLKGNLNKLGFITPTDVQKRSLPVPSIVSTGHVFFLDSHCPHNFAHTFRQSLLERMLWCKPIREAARHSSIACRYYHVLMLPTQPSKL